MRIGLVFGLALAACTTGPLNGTKTADNVVGKSFNFNGYYNAPNELIRLEVLKEPNLDPADDASWGLLGAALTSTTGESFHSSALLYPWHVDLAVVPSNASATVKKRWPQGGVARVRAVHIANDLSRDVLVSFDEVTWGDCLTEHASESWQDIGQACTGLGGGHVGLVSTTPVAHPNFNVETEGFLGAKGFLSAAETVQYYAQIEAPPFLFQWKQKYGFPAGEVVARYYNDADLGLGREMHCRTLFTLSGPGLACYVTNYSGANFAGIFDLPVNEVFNQMATGVGGFATVAMVYEPPANSFNAVKFFVYDAVQNLATTAKLDNAGHNDSVPTNCLACHGIDSAYNPVFNQVLSNAEFLPFDVFSFKFKDQAGWRRDDQQDAFRRLNAMVKLASATPATAALIDGMYAPDPVTSVGAVANDTFVPADWNVNTASKSMYNGVIKRYCRTCHVSSNVATRDFAQRADFDALQGAIINRVCNNHTMPHAERTLNKFWNSGARAYLLTDFGIGNICK